MVSETLGHYRIAEKIGAGGMGEVYRARDEQLDRDAALKVLPAGTLADEAARKQFRKEALTLAKLNHPNIETIFEFNTQDGVDFLAMELIPGHSLKEKLKEGPLPEKEILRLGMQLAEGLTAAHEQGVVHRDLKPGNLMITPGGRLKILDFGLAKLVRPELGADVTQSISTGAWPVSGTVPYMSPEQLRGEPVDARSDIYSAGAVLYEMATGQRPFVQTHGPTLVGAILHQAATPPRSLNRHLTPTFERVILKALEKEPARRYQSARELLVALEGVATHMELFPTHPRWAFIPGTAAIAVVLAVGGWLYYARRAHALRETDMVVLADFSNNTGDTVFDDTLKQGLAVQLAQSPFLNILSEQKVRDTLKLMGHSQNDRLTPDLARELCQRVGSKAYLSGSIASLGSQYVIGVNAVNCQSGDTLAREQMTAGGKEQVLTALDKAAKKLRSRLGESLSSIQKFGTPLFQETTSSLEALKAFTLGIRAEHEKGPAAALSYYQRAVELDPNFATAYYGIGTSYRNQNQPARAAEYLTKAFELRQHASEQEKLFIAFSYYSNVTGQLERARQTFQEWVESYPRSFVAYSNMSDVYASLGQWEKAAEAANEALRLQPDNVIAAENLSQAYMALNRFDEAQKILTQTLARKLDDDLIHVGLYGIDFLQGNALGMATQIAWFGAKPDLEHERWALESDTESYYGHLQRARELTRRAVEKAIGTDNKEAGAGWEANAALEDAVFGNLARARKEAEESLHLAPGNRDIETETALVFAMARDSARAEALAEDLGQRFPLHTLVQSYWLPTIRAELALERNSAVRAVESLQMVTPLEWSNTAFSLNISCLYPVYVRGQAYLAEGQGSAAAAEFHKLLDHRGIIQNCPLGAVAYLGLARAYHLAGDIAKSRSAYQDFFRLWKDAGPDIPILRQAKAEYAKLP